MPTFIDRAVIEVRSGKGGDGAIAFRREKYVAKGGPAGGNGGRGGSVIFRANSHINTLFNFRHSKAFIAKDGENGGIKNQYGHASPDVIVDVPLGTVIFEEKDHVFLGDLVEDGKTIVVAKGGRGGRGNTCFKSSTNRVPKIAENGEPGIRKRLILELKMLADVGLVGFPSVGKSTLLSVVSAAKPEIADYPFTTIVPNLGLVSAKDGRSFVMADLPGLMYLNIPGHKESVMLEKYPVYDESLVDESSEGQVNVLFAMIKDVRNYKIENKLAPNAKLELKIKLKINVFDDFVTYLKRFTFSDVEFVEDLENKGDINVYNEGSMLIKNEAGKEDLIKKLEKDIESIKSEIFRCEKMLGNPGFVSKAPAEKIALEKNKLEQHKKNLAELEAKLSSLK